MSEKINLSDMESIITEVLENDSRVTITASGSSMEPLIRNGKDNVILKKQNKKIRVGDIILYKRSNGKLVLHRVVGKDENGFILRGDNQWSMEYGITESNIIAVLDSIEKNGKIYKSNGIYCEIYKKILPAVKAERRVKNSIRLRLRGENKK